LDLIDQDADGTVSKSELIKFFSVLNSATGVVPKEDDFVVRHWFGKQKHELASLLEDIPDDEVEIYCTQIAELQASDAPTDAVKCGLQELVNGCCSDQQLHVLWEKYDTDKSGSLDPKEVQKMLTDLLTKQSEALSYSLEIERDTVDQTSRKGLEYEKQLSQAIEKICSMLADFQVEGNATIQSIFKMFDKNNDGEISKKEFISKANEVVFSQLNF